MGDLFDAGGEKAPQEVVVAVQLVRKEQGGFAILFVPPLHAHPPQLGQGQKGHMVPLPPQGEQLLHPRPAVHLLALAGAEELCLRRSSGRAGVKAQLVDELGKLQLQQQVIQGALVPATAGGG